MPETHKSNLLEGTLIGVAEGEALVCVVGAEFSKGQAVEDRCGNAQIGTRRKR